MQQQFPHNPDTWFTGWEARVIGREDLTHDYPWHFWREPFSDRMSRSLVNPASVPDPQRYNFMTDVDRQSTMVNIQPTPRDPLQFTFDAEENKRQWYLERGLSPHMDDMHREMFGRDQQQAAVRRDEADRLRDYRRDLPPVP